MPVSTVTLSGDALLGSTPHSFLRGALLSTVDPDELTSKLLPHDVCLGRISPPPSDKLNALRLSSYLKDDFKYSLPPLPIDYYTKASPSLARMYRNNVKGCCVISSAAHQVGLWTANESGEATQCTDAEIDRMYAIWNPGNQDNGCVITYVLDYVRDHGFPFNGVIHKIEDYVAVDWTDWDEVLVAAYIFGSLKLGINLPDDWTSKALWDVTSSRIVGGHDVPVVGALAVIQTYNGPVARIASWGRTYDITKPAFTSRKWLAECWGVLSPDWFAKASRAPNLIAAADLRSDLAKFRSGQIPDIGTSPPPPPPGPPPPPSPPPPPTPGPVNWQVFKDDSMGQFFAGVSQNRSAALAYWQRAGCALGVQSSESFPE